MEQKITLPSDDDLVHMERQRNWVREHFEPDARYKYAIMHETLRLIQTIVDSRWIEKHEKWKLQSLGISFGDALAQKLKMHWVMVDDEYGSDPALALSGSTFVAFPLTMISKRIEQGERIDVYFLFDEVCRLADEATRNAD